MKTLKSEFSSTVARITKMGGDGKIRNRLGRMDRVRGIHVGSGRNAISVVEGKISKLKI